MRWLREKAGVRQDDLAAAVRRHGLDWNRATVAGVETGRRRLELGEFFKLLLALQAINPPHPDGGIRGLELRDLLPHDEWLVIGRSQTSSAFLRNMLSGDAFKPPPSPDRRPSGWEPAFLETPALRKRRREGVAPDVGARR